MSYILDALKKAAEQRDAHAPAMRRLLSPAPDADDAPRWRMAVIGGGAAFAGGLLAVWLLWPATPATTVMPLTPPASQTVAEPPVVAPPPSPPAAPLVRTAPLAPHAATPPTLPEARAPRAVIDKRALSPRTPGPETSQSAESAPRIDTSRPVEVARPTEPRPPRAAASAPAAVAALKPSPSEAPAAVAPAPVRPAPPAPGAAPPKPQLSAPVRLEVIVYAEEKSRRLAFINGRKYVEGDTILDNATIQEIQPNAVVIVEDGRRVVLRP